MKNIPVYSLLCILMFSFSETNAQTREWTKYTTGGESEGYYCTTDKQNNVYITGVTQGKVYFSPDSVDGNGIFIVKYNSDGDIKWAINTIGGYIQDLFPMGMTTDLFGNEYLLGSYDTTVYFGSYTLALPGPRNNYFFVAKIDSEGGVKWIKNIGNAASYLRDYPILYPGSNMITTDVQGNIYITCPFSNSPTIGTYFLPNAATDTSNDILVAKFDSSGSVLWAKKYGGKHDEYPQGITLTPAHNIYVNGYFKSDSILFGTTALIDTYASFNYTALFLAKLDSNGNPIWARGAGGNSYTETFTGSISNSAEDVYIVGSYSGNNNGSVFANSLKLGSYFLPDPPPTPFGATSIYGFLAKYDSAGNVVWVKIMQGNYITPFTVSLDPCNNIWISAGNGLSFTSTFIDTIDGHIVLPPSAGIDPMFIAGWDSSGLYLQSIALASGGDDMNSIAIDENSNIFIEGDSIEGGVEYNFAAKFNPNLGCVSSIIPEIHKYAPDIILTPNPAHNELLITSTEKINLLVITNLWGQIIYTHKYDSEEISVDVTKLSPGMYLVRVNGITVRKFVKE